MTTFASQAFSHTKAGKRNVRTDMFEDSVGLTDDSEDLM